jgi:hypothetical protein
MRVKSREALPVEHACLKCKKTKPLAEIIVVREKKTGHFLVRARCKECHNKKECGHRREYKTRYLRRWRKHNADLNESYWRQYNAENREHLTSLAYERFQRHHEAILIQGRLHRRGIKVSIQEARDLYKRFGQCYPTRYGLTPTGLREAERIRSSQRRLPKAKRFSNLEIRMLLYEDGYFITPKRQIRPYLKSAAKLKAFQAAKHADLPRRAA